METLSTAAATVATHTGDIFNFATTHAFLETWQYLLDTYGEFAVAAGGSFVLHQVIYIALSAPYFFMQFIPFFNRYKIQPVEKLTLAGQWKCTKLLAFSHLFIQVPMMLGMYNYCYLTGVSFAPRSIPMIPFFFKAILCFVLEDTYHYFMHRAMHHPKLYKHVHKWHHYYTSPFGMTAEYAHPLETAVLGLGTLMGPMLCVNHVFELWMWIGLRLIETIDVHSGYHFPINPLNLIPGYGGSRAHDLHHSEFVYNYSSTFTWWDNLLGTAKVTWNGVERPVKKSKKKSQ